MRVLQFAKRSVLTLAAAGAMLSGCGGDSGPDVPFNPGATSADLEAVNSTFESPAFNSFSTFSLFFDAALGGTPLISGSAAAIEVRARGKDGMQAAARRAAERLGAVLRSRSHSSFSASAAAISAEVAGKTFVYDGASYVLSDRTGAPSNGVRFILYAVDPVTLLPTAQLEETGYVDLIDLSSGSTTAARVLVVSGTTTYLNYTVSITSGASSGRISVVGFVTDGAHQANINLRSTLTLTGGLSLTYSLDVPTMDVSMDLTLLAEGLDPETGTFQLDLDLHGPNGWVQMSGEFGAEGGTLTVRVSGSHFATITSTTGAEPVITRADGQPMSDEEYTALSEIFGMSVEAFAAFDQLFAPVGMFLAPEA